MKSFTMCSYIFANIVIPCVAKYKDIPCEWKSLTGAHFDLKPLMLTPGAPSFSIKDGDIPCTPEEEPAYSYVWNFCGEVNK